MNFPVVVYLNDIIVLSDLQEYVRADTIQAIKRLTVAGFINNLKMSQLIETLAKVLGHFLSSGGYWAPNTTTMEALSTIPYA